MKDIASIYTDKLNKLKDLFSNFRIYIAALSFVKTITPILRCFKNIKFLNCHEHQFYKIPENLLYTEIDILQIKIRSTRYSHYLFEAKQFPESIYFLKGIKSLRIEMRGFRCESIDPSKLPELECILFRCYAHEKDQFYLLMPRYPIITK